MLVQVKSEQMVKGYTYSATPHKICEMKDFIHQALLRQTAYIFQQISTVSEILLAHNGPFSVDECNNHEYG